jgi:hypothetical protein
VASARSCLSGSTKTEYQTPLRPGQSPPQGERCIEHPSMALNNSWAEDELSIDSRQLNKFSISFTVACKIPPAQLIRNSRQVLGTFVVTASRSDTCLGAFYKQVIRRVEICFVGHTPAALSADQRFEMISVFPSASEQCPPPIHQRERFLLHGVICREFQFHWLRSTAILSTPGTKQIGEAKWWLHHLKFS